MPRSARPVRRLAASLPVLLLASLLALAGAGARAQSASDGLRAGTFTAGGLERDYLLHLPAEPAGAPLLLVLHGRGGTPAGTAALTRFHEVAPGAAVAYPAGLDAQYNYPRGVPGYPAEPDDVAFLFGLAADLAARHGLDPARLYAVGFSNGGFMAQRLACAAPERLAGVASVGAAGFGGMQLVCPAEAPATGDLRPAVLLVHGTADAVIPWDGLRARGAAGPVPVLWPVPETFAFWALRNGCRGVPERSEGPIDPESGTRTTRLALSACRAAPVALTAVAGGGHTWPGAPGMLPDSLGPVAPFDASAEIWSFLVGAREAEARE